MEIITEVVQENNDQRIKAILSQGESKTIEFKSSLRYDLKIKSPQKHIEHTAFKNIAAFLNSEGGTLFLGV